MGSSASVIPSPSGPAGSRPAGAPRRFDRAAFETAYEEVILGNSFFEIPQYYVQNRPRYRNTVKRLCRLPLPPKAEIMEVGGGQTALLMSRIFGDKGSCGDLYDTYASSLTKHGVDLFLYDLTRDEPPAGRTWDLVLLLEVVEHMPVPPHIILEKLRRAIKPGGFLFVTTPNLYRFRNLVRLATGKEVLQTFFYPDPGQGIGHPIEYSDKHLRWQLERAGFTVEWTELCQLCNNAASFPAQVGRWLSRPLYARPLWRDNLIAAARNPG
jgi:SAM-dependent methyltransferase